jgi:hypothetical protein
MAVSEDFGMIRVQRSGVATIGLKWESFHYAFNQEKLLSYGQLFPEVAIEPMPFNSDMIRFSRIKGHDVGSPTRRRIMGTLGDS